MIVEEDNKTYDWTQKNLEGFTKEALIAHIRWLYRKIESLIDGR